jgi:hypothetical protein
MPAAGATGGEGSFAAALASELGGEATVYAHNVKGHLASNPLARVFTADSPSGRNMFDVLYPPAFLSGEAGRLRRDHTAIVGELDESALTAGLRRTAWLHYTDAVEADYYRINTRNRHFTIGGIGGVGAAMFMDPAGTAAVLQADFANVWLTPARIQGLR